MSQRSESRAVALDIKGAFDRVWHAGLLSKLKSNGVIGNLLEWISLCLSGRSIRVVIARQSSSLKPSLGQLVSLKRASGAQPFSRFTSTTSLILSDLLRWSRMPMTSLCIISLCVAMGQCCELAAQLNIDLLPPGEGSRRCSSRLPRHSVCCPGKNNETTQPFFSMATLLRK